MDDINKKLLDMELLDRLAGQRITSLVQKRIQEHIRITCYSIFDKSHLDSLLKVSFNYITFRVNYQLRSI